MMTHDELIESVTGSIMELTMPRWFDRHLHLRTGKMLKNVLGCTLKQKATGAVIMGNLPHPHQTSTIENTRRYQKEIKKERDYYFEHCHPFVGYGADNFEPCMTLYLTDEITPEEVARGFDEGVWRAVKLYMANQKGQGGTTGSRHGVKDLKGRYSVFEVMHDKKIPLLGHFEAVEEAVDEFDREIRSIERDLQGFILKEFPEIPVVVEHITDGRTADFVAETSANVYATATPQHLMINRNAMFWGGSSRSMNPGHYCLPVPKREEHRMKIRKHVTSGNSRFGAGTDSAPHDESAKSRCYGCAAGIFTAPVAVELYATVFDEENSLKHLQAFLSENFLHLYGMEMSKEIMTIKRRPLIVPQKVGSVQVFKGGTTLPWTLSGQVETLSSKAV